MTITITDIQTIEKYVDNNNYKKNCSIYFCIPLYCTKCIFDLSFYYNKIDYLQTFFCGFRNN